MDPGKNTAVLLLVFVFFTAAFFCHGSEGSSEIRVTRLGSRLFRMSRGVNNWMVLTGPDGVLLSDSAPAPLAPSIKAKLKKMGHDHVAYIINTHWHHDHCGGNLAFGKEAVIIAHHSVRDHLSARQKVSLFDETFDPYPAYALPKILLFSDMTLYLNGEEIRLIPLTGGHSKGDIGVYFTRANVLHAGDIYISGQFPPIDVEHGGDVQRLAENLSWIIQHMPPDVTIVSGHLADGTIGDLKDYRRMILDTVSVVRREMTAGKSLEEMQKAGILGNWKQWGKHITCDLWIRIIHHSLSKLPNKRPS